MRRVPIDELDSALLALLQRDARQTNRELASKLNIAPSTCLERVRGLWQRGIITGYHARADLPALSRPIQAMVAVRVRPPNRAVIEGFQDYVASLEEVLSVFIVAGGDDFLLHIAVPDMEHLNGFVLDKLTRRRELIDVRTSVVFRHIHNAVVGPMTPAPATASLVPRPSRARSSLKRGRVQE